MNYLIMHAVIIYMRWFLNTNGKERLNAKDYFDDNSEEYKVHMKIKEIRNKCIAHQEEDIFEIDYVGAVFSDDGKFQELACKWRQKLFTHENFDIDLDAFKRCIEFVHNKINPDLENKQKQLAEKLQEIYKNGLSKEEEKSATKIEMHME